MNSKSWPSVAFLVLLSFHLYYVGVLSSKIDPVKACVNIMDQVGKDNKLVRFADPSRENYYRFYNAENIKPGFEKMPDFIVGEAFMLTKGNSDFECRIKMYN